MLEGGSGCICGGWGRYFHILSLFVEKSQFLFLVTFAKVDFFVFFALFSLLSVLKYFIILVFLFSVENSKKRLAMWKNI